MPIYEYEHEDGACDKEGKPNRFEELQSIKDEPLAACPHCGKPVHRIISLPGKPVMNVLSPSNLTEKGFTQYTRRDHGAYERTAGEEGPSRFEIPPE